MIEGVLRAFKEIFIATVMLEGSVLLLMAVSIFGKIPIFKNFIPTRRSVRLVSVCLVEPLNLFMVF